MFAPQILRAGASVARFVSRRPGTTLGIGAGALAGGAVLSRATAPGGGGGGAVYGYRRRRRRRLTQTALAELTMLKNILGKTAAANALPYYLGRGG